MHGQFMFSGVSLDALTKGERVEGFYFCAGNTDEHFILRDTYIVNSSRRQINSIAVLVDKTTVKILRQEKKMDKEYEVTVTVSFNGHRITRTNKVQALSPEMAKELAEAMADVDIMVSSGTPRVQEEK